MLVNLVDLTVAKTAAGYRKVGVEARVLAKWTCREDEQPR